jgi:flagellar basal body-associated protein FliL
MTIREEMNMKQKKWILLFSLICLFFVLAGWVSWTLFSSEKSAVPMNSDITSNPGKTIEESDDISEEVVNKPTKEDIVVFSASEFENAHDFIEEFHDFYNTTLCWGRVNSRL